MRHQERAVLDLVETLKALRNDVSVVVHLYKQLYDATLIAIVQPGTEKSLTAMAFLSYDTESGIRELPLFSSIEAVNDFHAAPPDAILVSMTGSVLWPRLLEVLPEDDSCQAAVDPIRDHGIRLTYAMVLGMVGQYGGEPSAA